MTAINRSSEFVQMEQKLETAFIRCEVIITKVSLKLINAENHIWEQTLKVQVLLVTVGHLVWFSTSNNHFSVFTSLAMLPLHKDDFSNSFFMY